LGEEYLNVIEKYLQQTIRLKVMNKVNAEERLGTERTKMRQAPGFFCDETIKGNFDERKYAKINKRL